MEDISKIADVTECFDDSKKNKLDADDKVLNDKFEKLRDIYRGKQWENIVTRGEKPKPTVNILSATVEQEVAMLSLPNPTILASPQEKKDLIGSMSMETAIQFVLKRNRLAMIQQMDIRNSIVLGTGFKKIRWNPEGIRYETKSSKAIGEVAIDVMDPLNIYPDPYAIDRKDWMYLHATYSRSKEYIEEVYDVKLNNDNFETITVRESWYTPSRKYPSGRLVVWTDDAVLRNDDNPYGFIPFYPLFNRKYSDQFWGQGEVESMYEVQQWLNVTLGFIIENAKLGSQFKLWTDDGGKKNKKISMDPLEVMHVQKGCKVGILSHQGLDAGWFGLFKALQNAVQTVSGVHDVSYGTSSGGVTAASAIMALQESGQKRMTLRQTNIAESMEEMSIGMIRLMKQFYPDKRWYRILGNKDGVDLIKAELSEYYDISVSFESALPEDKMGKLNIAIAISQMPPEARGMLIKLLNDPTITSLLLEQGQLQQLQQMAQQVPTTAQQVPTQTGEEAR